MDSNTNQENNLCGIILSLTTQRNRQNPLNIQVEQPTQEFLSSPGKQWVCDHFTIKLTGQRKARSGLGPEGEIWQLFLGDLAGGHGFWLWPQIYSYNEWALARYFPSTSVSSSVGWRLHTSPMGCNEDRMKSREKFITLMATHKKELRVSFSFPGLYLAGRGERNIEKEHAHFSLLFGIKLSFLCQVQGETNIFPSAGLGFWLLHDKSHSGDLYLELILADFPLKLTSYVEAKRTWF